MGGRFSEPQHEFHVADRVGAELRGRSAELFAVDRSFGQRGQCGPEVRGGVPSLRQPQQLCRAFVEMSLFTDQVHGRDGVM